MARRCGWSKANLQESWHVVVLGRMVLRSVFSPDLRTSLLQYFTRKLCFVSDSQITFRDEGPACRLRERNILSKSVSTEEKVESVRGDRESLFTTSRDHYPLTQLPGLRLTK